MTCCCVGGGAYLTLKYLFYMELQIYPKRKMISCGFVYNNIKGRSAAAIICKIPNHVKINCWRISL